MSDTIATRVLQQFQAACDTTEGRPGVKPETPLSALGIHSLRLIELVYELEVRFDVQVDEELLARLQTVADVQHMFQAATLARQGADAAEAHAPSLHEEDQP
jgi:acyl carrier protein